MPSIISDFFRVASAKSFVDSFSANPTYMTLGKITPWVATTNYPSASDSNPPTPEDSIDGISKVWKNIIGAKRIQSTDVSVGIPRINWTSGTTYIEYNSNDPDLFTKNFYVLTDDLNIYKCISNNFGNVAGSTVKPTGTSTGTTSTADGYKWKYMATVSGTESSKFLTPQHVPVHLATAGDGSTQADTQDAAIAGAILSYKIISVGSGLSSAPTFTVVGDGTGATVTGTIASGVLVSLNVTGIGSGYTYATVTSSAGGVVIQANIAPAGGHGKNILNELGAYYSIMSTKFQYSESGTISTENNVREISVIRNPLAFGTTTGYTASTARQTTRITLASVTGYTKDEVVVGGTSGASAEIVEIDATNKYLYVVNQKKTFTSSETITGQTSTIVSTASAINNPSLQKNSGDILYIEDRMPINRASDQSESFVIVVEF